MSAGTIEAAGKAAPAHLSRWRSLRALLRNPAAVAGLSMLLLLATVAALAPVLAPGDPLDMVARPFIWPGQDWSVPLGTDQLGRDVLAGIIHGARVSLLVGVSASLVGLAVGIIVGTLSGYFGGWTEHILMRLVEIFQTVPGFVLLIVVVAIASPSAVNIAFAIGLTTWPTVARLVRAEFRSLRERDFVLAAQGMGYGHGRIILREILPNALPPIIVMSSVMMASAILTESALSFMGLGDPNRISWGSMIGAGRALLRTAWYLSAVPGIAVVIAVLSLNLLGDGLNDALNPRLLQDRRS